MKYLIYIIACIIIVGGVCASFVYLPAEKQLATVSDSVECPECICEECLECPPCDIKECAKCEPIIKEVIKEVPVEVIKEVKVIKEIEKIVYREVECPACPTTPIETDITLGRDSLSGNYLFRTTGEDFILREMVVRLQSSFPSISPPSIFFYKINEDHEQKISLKDYSMENAIISVLLDGTGSDIIFPKNSEIIVSRSGYYKIEYHPFEIIKMSFRGTTTGRFISLP